MGFQLVPILKILNDLEQP